MENKKAFGHALAIFTIFIRTACHLKAGSRN